MGALWGQPGKAGKTRRPEQVAEPSGRQASPGNAIPAAGTRYGPNPIAFAYAYRLGVASSLTSPAVRGRFRSHADASPSSRGNGTPDLGALQTFRGLVGLPSRLKLGAQGGPSAQAGYPSTGNGNTVISGLAAMGRPDVQRIRGL